MGVTGPTGTFGFGPPAAADPRVGRIVGTARRRFGPAEHGWTKKEYRRADVRHQAALREAGADVVVHLAFLIVGGKRDTTRAINIAGA